jgi:hypothetical protein
VRTALALAALLLATGAAAQTIVEQTDVTQTALGLPNTARLAICQPGEWVDENVQGFPWATIMCDRDRRSANPHVHQRPGITFNGAECQPWIVIIYVDNTVSIYCAPRP